MASKKRPDGTGKSGPGTDKPDLRDDDLERRRRELEASLATRMPERRNGSEGARPDATSGYGQALKLSSEFIAGIVVGAGLGWIIDYLAGTSPWGLIVFLFLGFGAGVLNVLRSAGMVAEAGSKQSDKGSDEPNTK
ncbi:AtpZ/AtpI family protein [Mesorhizobium sp. 1B3]|uniref:AtpZ/AtpI family protein n=1 Tax=Mesorhizobium sp. 1B3 TaxID=3243599 RepID=UPI003D95AD67